MDIHEDVLLKTMAERDDQQRKVDRLENEMEKYRSRLTKEKDKLKNLEDKIDREEFFLIRKRLADELDLTGDDAFDVLIDVYKKYNSERN